MLNMLQLLLPATLHSSTKQLLEPTLHAPGDLGADSVGPAPSCFSESRSEAWWSTSTMPMVQDVAGPCMLVACSTGCLSISSTETACGAGAAGLPPSMNSLRNRASASTTSEAQAWSKVSMSSHDRVSTSRSWYDDPACWLAWELPATDIAKTRVHADVLSNSRKGPRDKWRDSLRPRLLQILNSIYEEKPKPTAHLS